MINTLYYVTKSKNQSVFDEIAEKKGITLSKKIQKTPLRLEVFAKNTIRNLDVKFLAIDIAAVFTAGIEEIINTVKSFKLINPESQVVLIANGVDLEHELIFALKQNQSNNYLLITETDKNKIEEQLDTFISLFLSEEIEDGYVDVDEEGIYEELEIYEDRDSKSISSDNIVGEKIELEKMYKAYAEPQKTASDEALKYAVQEENKIIEDNPKGKTGKLKSIKDLLTTNLISNHKEIIKWNCENVMIGCAGVSGRVGTSTVALHLSEYLKFNDAAVIFSETGTILEQLEIDYPIQKMDENIYEYKGVNYYTQGSFEEGKNFIIFDLGIYNENTERIRSNLDELILVTDYSKNLRLKALEVKKQMECEILYTFISANDKKIAEEHNEKINEFKHSPDFLTRNKENDNVFEKIIKRFKG